MYAESPVRPTAFQATKGSDRQGSFRRSWRWHNERSPPWLAFRTVATDLVFWQAHESLEAFFKIFLIRHDGDDASKRLGGIKNENSKTLLLNRNCLRQTDRSIQGYQTSCIHCNYPMTLQCRTSNRRDTNSNNVRHESPATRWITPIPLLGV